MRFEFATDSRIVFGPGSLAQAGAIARAWGRRAFVVTGRDPGRARHLATLLGEAGVAAEVFPVAGEPTVGAVASALAAAREGRAELVIGFGGGGAIDAAKAVAGLLANPGDPLDYLEVVGRGAPLANPALPWMAVPTTAGTGAEVTKNAVLGVPERGVKVSLRSPQLLARVALVDPELTIGLPPGPTAASGMDALAQLIEAYVCCRSNPMTDALCAEGLPRFARAFPAVWRDPGDIGARTDVALASLLSGLALANAGLGAVHGFAAPLGGLFSAPHGEVCAALLGPVMAANLSALGEGGDPGGALGRYAELARWLTGRADAQASDGVAWVRGWVETLGIRRLSAHGLTRERIGEVVARAKAASSMKANPVVLSDGALSAILAESL